MQVVVVGAGIGGLAAAVGLTADGHDVQVLEEAPALRTSGGAVTLWSGGTGVSAALGVDVGSLGQRLARMERWTPDGERVLSLDLARAARRLGSPVVTTRRGPLVAELAARLPAGAVRTSAGCLRVSRGTDHAVVHGTDGSRTAADLVVGADGSRSAVRRSLLREGPRPTGGTTWQLPLSRLDLGLPDERTCVLLVGWEGMVGLNPAGDGLVQVWFDVWTPPSQTTGSPAQMLRNRFGGWGAEPVTRALEALDDATLVPYPRISHRVGTTWGAGRVTLLGDAAHAFPPSLAQGTNQALEDVRELRAALRGCTDVARALRRYERVSSRRVLAVSAASSRELSLRVVPPALLRAVPDRAATSLLQAWSRVTSGRDLARSA